MNIGYRTFTVFHLERLHKCMKNTCDLKCESVNGRYAEPLIGLDLIGLDLIVSVLIGLVLIG